MVRHLVRGGREAGDLGTDDVQRLLQGRGAEHHKPAGELCRGPKDVGRVGERGVVGLEGLDGGGEAEGRGGAGAGCAVSQSVGHGEKRKKKKVNRKQRRGPKLNKRQTHTNPNPKINEM